VLRVAFPWIGIGPNGIDLILAAAVMADQPPEIALALSRQEEPERPLPEQEVDTRSIAAWIRQVRKRTAHGGLDRRPHRPPQVIECRQPALDPPLPEGRLGFDQPRLDPAREHDRARPIDRILARMEDP